MARAFFILLLVTPAHAEEISHKKNVAGTALLVVSAAAAVGAIVCGAIAAQPVAGNQSDGLFPHEKEAMSAFSLGTVSVFTSAVGLPLYLGGRANPSRRLALRRGGYAMMGLAATTTALTLIGIGLTFAPSRDASDAGLIMSTAGASWTAVSLAIGVPLVTF